MVLIQRSSSFRYFYPKQALKYILQSLKYLFIISSHVNLDLFLCFLDGLEYRYVLMPHEAIIGYDQTLTNDVRPTSFELVPHHFTRIIFISDSVSSCMVTDLAQHSHFGYTFLDMLSFSNPAFCTIHHRRPNHRPVKLNF
jgi:hypothetical protein